MQSITQNGQVLASSQAASVMGNAVDSWLHKQLVRLAARSAFKELRPELRAKTCRLWIAAEIGNAQLVNFIRALRLAWGAFILSAFIVSGNKRQRFAGQKSLLNLRALSLNWFSWLL